MYKFKNFTYDPETSNFKFNDNRFSCDSWVDSTGQPSVSIKTDGVDIPIFKFWNRIEEKYLEGLDIMIDSIDEFGIEKLIEFWKFLNKKTEVIGILIDYDL